MKTIDRSKNTMNVTTTIGGVVTKKVNVLTPDVNALHEQFKKELDNACDYRLYNDHKSSAGQYCEVTYYYYKTRASKNKTIAGVWLTDNYINKTTTN